MRLFLLLLLAVLVASASLPHTAIAETDAIDGFVETAVIRLNAAGQPAIIPSAVVTSSTGLAMVAGLRTLDGASVLMVERIRANGQPDPSFGGSGVVEVIRGLYCAHPPLLSSDPDQTSVIVVVSAATEPSCGVVRPLMFRILNDESGNPGFAIVGPSSGSTPNIAIETNRDASGRLLLTMESGTLSGFFSETYVARPTSNGLVDPSFGAERRITIDAIPRTSAREARLVVLSNGHLLIASAIDGLVQLTEWEADGHPVALPNGHASFAFDFRLYARPGEVMHLVALHRLADGANLVVMNREGSVNALVIGRAAPDQPGSLGSTSNLIGTLPPASWPVTLPFEDASIAIAEITGAAPATTARIRRMYPDSGFDATLGPGAAIAVGTLNTSITGLARDASGRLLAIGRDNDGGWLRFFNVSLRPNYKKGFGTEYFNSPLTHYFVTADQAEVSAIQSGHAGPGWARTNYGFRMYPIDSPMPEETVGVCRFYGNQAVDPATGVAKGPNSHVYVLDGPECVAVKRDPGWIFEGIVFYIHPPKAGACDFWQTPVIRFYNRGAARHDSNHRYVTNAELIAQMTAAGWSNEGTVMCAP